MRITVEMHRCDDGDTTTIVAALQHLEVVGRLNSTVTSFICTYVEQTYYLKGNLERR